MHQKSLKSIKNIDRGNTEKSQTINVRLLREKCMPEATFTGKYKTKKNKIKLKELKWPEIEGARFFIGKIYDSSPKWLDFLPQDIPDLPVNIKTKGVGAVLFLPLEKVNRIVAVCFGHVHLALKSECFERRFGLKVALNSIPRHQLRTIEFATPDAVTFQKRIQASKDSNIQEFNVDKIRDLVRVVGGKPEKPEFASFVAGKDSLSVTCKVNFDNIRKKCEDIFDMSKEDSYKEKFEWIDNIKPLDSIDDETKIKKLNGKLKEAIENLLVGKETELHISPPEIVNYTNGLTISYDGFDSKNDEPHCRLSIDDYIDELRACKFKVDIDEIIKHRIKVNEDESPQNWHVYDCFVFDTSLETKESGEDAGHYVLFAGEWYKIEETFKERIDETFKDVVLENEKRIIRYTDQPNEQKLIEDLEKLPNLINLDRVMIKVPDDPRGKIESCDFFSNKRDFIHLKDGKGSAPISHLWFQGVVSAEMFVSNQRFLENLRIEVKNAEEKKAEVMKVKHKFMESLPKRIEDLDRGKYRVVYGIMRPPSKIKFNLPFFSKVSLKTAVDRLNQLGIPVAIEIIEKRDPNK